MAPTWSEILNEVMAQQRQNPSVPAVDTVRRKYLRELSNYTGRPAILYATRWMDQPVLSPVDVQIDWGDKEAFMEAVHTIKGDQLDLIIHSPGGQIEAAQSIVEYLRSKFRHIRVFVPDAAMSAATLIALSADVIVMGRHSNLGPIDPQFLVPLQNMLIPVSAQSLLEEFEMAKEQVKKDKDLLLIWAPKIQQYPPGLLVEARNAIELTKELGREWLSKYMFNGDPDGRSKAERIIEFLANHSLLKSHSAPVGREKLKELGVKVIDLEDDQKLQDLVLSVYHATRITFQLTPAHKIIESSGGSSYIKLVTPTPPPQQGPAPGQGPSRPLKGSP